MAGSFADLRANLNLNISNFSQKLSQASAQARSFAASLNGKTVQEMEELRKQTNAWGLNLKSVSRVVSGILISQTFYRGVQSINAATAAVWDFTKQLEYAHIAYSNLFNDKALATEFINVLKDFAAESPFSFTEAEKAAKRLLAYGIEYKNVMYVMQGVMSAASIQGDPAKIESISRAFGQIYTYGKLMTQEVRQLSEAGIPAFEILQEELGLTQKELRDLGNQGIPASDAINALVDGIQKRFGNVTVAAAKTVTGIISNIQDNATMLFASIFQPLTTFIKSALVVLGDFLFAMRELNELKGLGGVFEAIVPEELQGTLRALAANAGNVFLAVIRLAHAFSGLLKPILVALVQVFNAFAPILSSVINVMAGMVSVITSNATAMRYLTAMLAAAAAMWVLFKVKAMASAAASAAIMVISRALAALHTMLTFVLVHPFWALLIGLGGVLIGISGGFGAISDKVSGLFKQLTSFNGIDPDKVLLPSQKDRANDLDKFNNKLEGTSDAMDDLADSTGKATKAAKGLLSFDEVFKLNEPDEGAGNGIIDPNLEDLLDGLGDLGGGFMPEIPDFSEYAKLLKNSFLEKFKEAWNKIKDLLPGIAGTSIGAAFGALLGWLLGGALGAKIGAVAGAIVGYFWNMLADYFGLTPDEKAKAGVIGGVGAGIGAIFGGILGGPFGAKIGAIIGGLVGSFWGILAEHLGIVDTQHIATLLGGLISGIFSGGIHLAKSLIANLTPLFIDDVFAGFARNVGFSLKGALVGALKQGVVGAIVGLVTGMLSNALTGWIAKELELTEKDLENAGIGQIIGSIIGSITGFILGGPMGSLVGGALGQLAGSIVGEFWSYMSATLKGTLIGGAAGLPIGAIVGTLVGSIGGPLGAALGAVIGAVLGALIGLIVDKWEPIKQFFTSAAEAIGQVFGSIEGIIVSSFGVNVTGAFNVLIMLGKVLYDAFLYIKDALLGMSDAVQQKLAPAVAFVKDIFEGLETFFVDFVKSVVAVWLDIRNAVETVLVDLFKAVITVWNDISSAVSTVCEDVRAVVDLIWNFIKDLFIKILSDMWQAVVDWFTPIADEISYACNRALELIRSAFTEAYNTIYTKVSEMFAVVSEMFTAIYSVVSDKVTKALSIVTEKFTKIYSNISSKVGQVLNVVTEKFNAVYTKIKDKLVAVQSIVFEKFSGIYSTVREKVASVYSTVSTYFSDIYSSIKSNITNMYSSVKDGISNIYSTFTNWISNMWTNVFSKFFTWITDGINKLREFFGLESEASSVSVPSSSGGSSRMSGHATGGIFNREHVARFAEGNKAEAVIPLENDSAMQPFVDAVANGITASLGPVLASVSGAGSNSLPPLYVGTLIADDRSLKELERKMEVIRMQEGRR